MLLKKKTFKKSKIYIFLNKSIQSNLKGKKLKIYIKFLFKILYECTGINRYYFKWFIYS